MKSPPHLHHRFFSSSSSTASISSLCNLIKGGISVSVTPSITHLNLHLSFLLRSQRFNLCLSFFSQITANSITPNPKSNAILAQALLKSCGGGSKDPENFISYAEKFGVKTGDGILNALVYKVCVLEKDPDWAFCLLQEFVTNYDLVPSRNTLYNLISAFCSRRDMDSAVKVFEVMSAREKDPSNLNHVCSMLISGFAKTGQLELGIRFFERVKKIQGFSPNLVTYTALVDALLKDGGIEEASDLISVLEDKGIVLDPVLYSGLISRYFRKGLLMDGLMKHCEMTKKGLSPNVVNYTNSIEGLCEEGSVPKVNGFLNEMLTTNISPNLVTLTVLIGGFCQRGQFKEALQVFDKIKELGIASDNFSETILVDSMCKSGQVDMAFAFIREIETKGMKPEIVSYNALINGLCKAGRTHEACRVAQDLPADNFTYTTLLHGFLKERDEQGILEIMKRLQKYNCSMDIVMCNMLIKALFSLGKVGDACNLFDKMHERNLVADSVTYCTMIDGFCQNGEINKALNLFELYKETSLHLNNPCSDFMIRRLIKAGRLDMAVHIFMECIKELLIPDSSTCFKLFVAQFEENGAEGILKLVREIENFENAVVLSSICDYAINFLSSKQCRNAAWKMYLSLHKRGLRITCKTSHVLMKSLVQSGIEEFTTSSFLCECIKLHGIFEPETLSLSSLHLSRFTSRKLISDGDVTEAVTELIKQARINDAYTILENANKNGISIDLSNFSLVIDSLCKAGSIEKALDLHETMRKRGITPSVESYNAILNGLCNHGCIGEAFQILDALERSNLQLTVFTYIPIIGAFCREGLLKDARVMFDKMLNQGITPDTSVSNILLYGCCNLCLKEDAINFLSSVNEKYSIQPDEFTISALIKGISFKGDIEGAFGLFSEYKQKGILPTFFGFMHLVSGFHSRGRLEEARGVIREMLSCTRIEVLVNKYGGEIYDEPLVSILLNACEQGRIHEVISILREVSYMLNSNLKNSEDLVELQDSYLNNNENLLGKSLYDDFDSYYPTVATLCMKGKLEEASDVINAMILNSA